MHGIYSSLEARVLPSETIGEKAKKLSILQLLGYSVPKWFVISNDAGLNIDRQSILEEIEKLLITEFAQNTRYIIRLSRTQSLTSSSLEIELLKKRINIKREHVYASIRDALNFSRTQKLNIYSSSSTSKDEINTAIIVQEFIPTEKAGVAFGFNTTTASLNEKIILANFGLQSSIKDGYKNYDAYTIYKNHTSSNITKKTHKIAIENEIPTKIYLQEKEKQSHTLNKAEIKNLNETLNSLKDHFGKVQKIEFGYYKNDLYLFNSTHNKSDLKVNRIEWEKQGIEEAFPKLSLPLTFSFASMVYQTSYKNMLNSLGIPKTSIDENFFSNIIGHIKGSIYLNVNKKKEYYQLFPAFFFKHFFEENSSLYFSEKYQKNRLSNIKMFLTSGYCFIDSFRKLPIQMKSFANNFDKTMYEFHKTPLQNLETYQLYDLFLQCKKNILNKWHIPLINNMFANFALGKIESFIQKLNDNGKNITLPDILMHCGGIISSQPFLIISNILEMIRNNQSLTILFKGNNSDEIYKYILKYPQSNISLKIFNYIHNYGNKVPFELNLEHITIRQEPTIFINTIKYLINNNISISIKEKDEINNLFQEHRLNLFEKTYITFLIAKINKLISNKELARLYKTRVFGFIRELFIAVGKKFASENIIAEHKDIFYLRIEEIFDFIHGKSSQYDLKSLTQLRKKEYNSLTNNRLPFKLTTYGTANQYDIKQRKIINDDFNGGEGCSKGIAKGHAVNITEIDQISNYRNPILIAEIIDPGHIDILLTIKGIVLEKGNQLSHVSIICRSLNIPSIINAKKASLHIKTGDLIEINGTEGKIKRIKTNNPTNKENKR